MAEEICLPFDYIVFHTGYTSEICNSKYNLKNLLDQYGLNYIRPLYIIDNEDSPESLKIFNEKSNKEFLNINDHNINNMDEIKKIRNTIKEIIGSDNEQTGLIAFKTGLKSSINDIFKLKNVLEDLDYCKLYNISSIKYIQSKFINKEDSSSTYKVLYVSIDSKSS